MHPFSGFIVIKTDGEIKRTLEEIISSEGYLKSECESDKTSIFFFYSHIHIITIWAQLDAVAEFYVFTVWNVGEKLCRLWDDTLTLFFVRVVSEIDWQAAQFPTRMYTNIRKHRHTHACKNDIIRYA